MCFIISLIPATFWVVVGYFVLFSTSRTEGNLKAFGKILAIWIFIIALIIPMGGFYMTVSGICPAHHSMMMRR